MASHPGPLFTDLYELAMLQAYHNEGMQGEAVFELFVRALPPERNFLVAAGLDDALTYLEDLAFSEADLAYLQSLGRFSPELLERLRTFRFSGSVRAVPEGTVVFANEPLLEVTAPIGQAQLVETYLLNQLTFQTLIASKGARVVLAARGRTVVDFGARRAHAADAAVKAARALYLSGFAATSLLAAGARYGIPVAGTMAHSYVQAHRDEEAAFRAFASTYPDTTLLVDTYDTEEGVRRVVDLARELGPAFQVRAVRLDSGDLLELSRRARQLLDAAGLGAVQVFASGGLDEYAIDRLLSQRAPIDGFGVGTAAVVSADVPRLDSAYKLVAYQGRGLMKLSAGKATLPGAKQVFRQFRDGVAEKDVIALADERVEGEPLLQPVMEGGRRLPAGRQSLAAARERAAAQVRALPHRLQTLEPAAPPYTVEVSPGLRAAEAALRRELARVAGGAHD